jgi:hypothetical protein
VVGLFWSTPLREEYRSVSTSFTLTEQIMWSFYLLLGLMICLHWLPHTGFSETPCEANVEIVSLVFPAMTGDWVAVFPRFNQHSSFRRLWEHTHEVQI